MPSWASSVKQFLDTKQRHKDENGREAEPSDALDSADATPKTYPQAWLALFLLVMLRTSVSIFQYTFSVVPGITGEFFGVSLTAVNWLANVQGLCYVMLSFITGWLFERLGVKRSLILAGLLNAAGSGLRCLAIKLEPPSFPLVMVGQVVGSAASPLSLNIMTMFAATWFTENMRATAGMFVASNYGAIIGMFVLPSVATSPDQIPLINVMAAIVAVVVLVPLFFMPAKPPVPPTLALPEASKPSFFMGLKLLFKIYPFWVLFLVHGFNVGLSIAFSTVFTQIVSPYGYTDAQAGQINAVAFFAGTLGSSIAGPVLDQTKQHKLFLRLVAPMVLVTDIGMVFLFYTNQYAAILFVTSLNQFFLSFMVPVVIELGSETSYPVADATTNSLMWQGAQTFGFLIVLIMDFLRDVDGSPPNNMYKALVFQAGLAGVNMVLAFCFWGRMARTEAIEEQKRHQTLDDK